MKDYHETQLKTIGLLDGKAYSILGVVGIIAGLFMGFSTLVLNEYQNRELVLLWIITFIFGIVLLIFSSWFCLRSIQLRYYVFYGPTPNDLIPYENREDADLHKDLIKAYNNILIKGNYNTILEKAYWVKNAVVALTYAIFIVFFAIIIVVLMAINLDISLSLFSLVSIILILIVVVQFITANEKKYIGDFAQSWKR